MTKRKRWMACLLTAALLAVSTGCGNTGDGGQGETGGGVANNGQSEVKESSENAGAQNQEVQDLSFLKGNTAPTQEEIDLVNKTFNDSYLEDVFKDDGFILGSDYSAYPIEGDVTLTIWMPMEAQIASMYTDWGDHPVFKHMEKLLGINLEFITPTLGEESTEFNLMLTNDSDNLPDIIMPGTMYPGGIGVGVEEGLYLDLTELIDQYMPNYKAVLDSNQDYAKEVKQEDGSIYAVYRVGAYPMLDWFYLMIKQEALDKTGLPVPETIDDWHEFLVACKNAGYTYPMVLNGFYGAYFTSAFCSAFGSYESFFLNTDGKVAWGPGQEGTKAYLQMMRDWYAEGLFNSDMVTGSFDDAVTYIVSEESASCLLWVDYYANSGIDYVVVPNPVMNKGDAAICTGGGAYTDSTAGSWYGTAAITTACKNVEAACAFLDFGFSKKGWEMYNYGSYGDVHLINEEGWPYYPESSIMFHDPEDQPADYLRNKYKIDAFPGFRDVENSYPSVDVMKLNGERFAVTEKHDHSLCLPPLTFTAEESERINVIGGNISTARYEYFTKIVMGQLPVDAWDDFMKEVEDMGLEELLTIYQTALDRYNAK